MIINDKQYLNPTISSMLKLMQINIFPLLQDDSEYSRLQHPGGQHTPQGIV
jgi:hypothetical protein